MNEIEVALNAIEQGLQDKTISKEEAKELLLDIERTLRVEDGASDMALKGVLLSSVAVLMGLV